MKKINDHLENTDSLSTKNLRQSEIFNYSEDTRSAFPSSYNQQIKKGATSSTSPTLSKQNVYSLCSSDESSDDEQITTVVNHKLGKESDNKLVPITQSTCTTKTHAEPDKVTVYYCCTSDEEIENKNDEVDDDDNKDDKYSS